MMWPHVFAISVVIFVYALFFLGGIKYMHNLQYKEEGKDESK